MTTTTTATTTAMRALVVGWCAVMGAACLPPTPTPPPDAGPEPDPIADCPALDSGDLTLTGVEAEPGFDDVVRAVDPDALPPTLPIARASAFERLLIGYLLEGHGIATVDGTEVLEVQAAAARGPMGLTVLAAIDGAGDVDVTVLRRGLHRFYGCARGFPPTLDEFLRTVHDWSQDAQETFPSTVKGLRRRVFRSAEAGVFVAETLNDDDTVRETELVLTDRRDDGALDFLEYDADGVLRGASRFAASGGGQTTGPAPFSCLACHGTDVVSPAPP